MERAGHPQFMNGLVNHLPHPEFDELTENELIKTANYLINLFGLLFNTEERGVDFTNNRFLNYSLEEFAEQRIIELDKLAVKYKDELERLNERVYNYFKVSNIEDIEKIINEAGGKSEETIFNVSKK